MPRAGPSFATHWLCDLEQSHFSRKGLSIGYAPTVCQSLGCGPRVNLIIKSLPHHCKEVWWPPFYRLETEALRIYLACSSLTQRGRIKLLRAPVSTSVTKKNYIRCPLEVSLILGVSKRTHPHTHILSRGVLILCLRVKRKKAESYTFKALAQHLCNRDR